MKTSLIPSIKTSLTLGMKVSIKLLLPMFFWFAIGLTAAVVLKPDIASLGSLIFDSEPSQRIYQHRTNTPIRVSSEDTTTSYRNSYFSG